MPRFRHIQNNFLSGELTPRAYGRTDLERYGQGLKKQFNMISKIRGGSERRPGTQFILDECVQRRLEDAASLNGGVAFGFSDDVRIFPFVFSKEEAYLIIIKADPTDTSICIINTNTNAEMTFTAFPIFIGTSGASAACSKFLNYTDIDDLNKVQFAQNGDFMYFTHPDYPPYYIARESASLFVKYDFPVRQSDVASGSTTAPHKNFPFLEPNTNTAVTLTTAGIFPTMTVTASSAIFTSDQVGSIFKYNDTGAGGSGLGSVGIISGFTSTTVVTVALMVGGPLAGAATTDFTFGAWSDKDGWPRSLTFHEQRLMFGGNNKSPNTVWGSQTADIHELDSPGIPQDPDFVDPIVNTDSFNFSISTTEPNQIQWMSSGKTLSIGTVGREYLASGSAGALGPLDIGFEGSTSFGSEFVQPVRQQNTVMFVQRSGKQVREFYFNRDEDAFRAKDLTLLADHLMDEKYDSLVTREEPRFVTIQQASAPDSVFWFLDNNGGLYGLSRDREEGTLSWHKHEFGGSLGDDPPDVLSTAVVPRNNTNSDELFVAVKRNIDSSDVVYIEKIGRQFERSDYNNTSTNIDDKLIYMDSTVLFQVASFPAGTATTSITGLDHLDGETVQVIADGFFVGEKTVSSGAITLDVAAQEAIVGLPYRSVINTLDIENGSAIGTSQSAIKRIDRLTLRVVKSLSMQFGQSESADDLEPIDLRPIDLDIDDTIPLFSGDITLDFDGDYERNATITVVQDDPFPMNISSLILRAITYD